MGVFLPPFTPLPPFYLIPPQRIAPKIADVETPMFRTT